METQGSSDMSRSKVKKVQNSRRSWTPKEEETLLAAVKELVVNGWKSDNGFRAGYLVKLEEAMQKAFPGSDIKATPHINSKLSTWKKNYGSLTSMLTKSGIGFNNNGDYMTDCENALWEEIVKIDSNARSMRYKPWPLFDAWKEIFVKDRATGESAEDILEAVNELEREDNTAEGGLGGHHNVSFDDFFDFEVADENISQVRGVDQPPKQRAKKRKNDEGLAGICEILSEMTRTTSARLEQLATRIGYEFDLGKARKDAYHQLCLIPGLSVDDKYGLYEFLAGKVDNLQIFMGLPDEAKPEYVMRLLINKVV